ncbi:MAG: DUF1576 domain-containing protein [Oscillospiraceae bacterium]|nr:DUF1576 domain-containing protein [Oscillospiraceae bacterium]
MKGKDTSGQILLILLGFSVALIIGALCAGDLGNLIPGFITIITRPSQFTMDYFKLGGLGSAFLNAGMVGLACCGLLYFSKAKCTGLTVAAYWLNVGFATFGMTFTNIWPFFFGVWVYSRLKKVSFGSVANQAMFATALAPFASELMFRYPGLETRGFTFTGLLLAILLGVFVGCVMPSLCAHSPNFHKGYDLYSAGPAAGFLAFFLYCFLYLGSGVKVPSNTDLGDGHRAFVNVFFIIVFTACLCAGAMMDKDVFKKYKALWKSDGYKTDYTAAFGVPATLLNMGVYGLFILLYYNVVHGMTIADGQLVFTPAKFTGATMGAIMCMFAFVAQGTQPRTVFPIMVGYAVASLVPFLFFAGGLAEAQKWTLTTQAILVGLCFASGLAPVSGKWGFFPGVIAGFIHALLVMNVPLLHGGFCLYNGGFTAGIVAFLLIPVLECFTKPVEERRAAKEPAAAEK